MSSLPTTPAPSKHLLLVTPDFPPATIGGGALVCQQLAWEYHRKGWDVTILSMDTRAAGPFIRSREVLLPTARVIFLPMATRLETAGVSMLLTLPPSIPGLIRALQEFRNQRWDAVHLHGNPSFLVDAVGVLCRLGSRPYVLTFHGTIGNPARFGRLGGSLYRALIALERRIFERANAITAVSETTLREVTLLGFRAHRTETVPNAGFVPASSAGIGPEIAKAVLARHGLLPGNFALCLGAFIPRKGQDLLLHAFAELAAGGAVPDSLALVFAGFERDREFSAELRRTATNAGLDARVRFLGEVSETEKDVLLRAARWVIMPSRYEASPVLAFEAMTVGCVLVAPDLPNFREIVGDSRSAVLFAAGDATSLSRALRDLGRAPEREPGLRAAALERSRLFAVWTDVAQAYLDLFSPPRTNPMPTVPS